MATSPAAQSLTYVTIQYNSTVFRKDNNYSTFEYFHKQGGNRIIFDNVTTRVHSVVLISVVLINFINLNKSSSFVRFCVKYSIKKTHIKE